MNTPKNPRPFPSDTRVQWREGCRPVAHPHERGTVFLSTSRVTVVHWDGGGKAHVATGALVRER